MYFRICNRILRTAFTHFPAGKTLCFLHRKFYFCILIVMYTLPMNISRFFLQGLLLLLTCGLMASCTAPGKKAKLAECPSSKHFSVYEPSGYAWVGRPYFSTPDGRWFRIYQNRLMRVTPENEEAEVYEANYDIIEASLRIMPDGGIFFLDGMKLYYLSPQGVLNSTTDTYAGVFTPIDDTWSGASFVTPQGLYGYITRDGDGIRANLRSTALTNMNTITLSNVPPGDCLGAYFDNDRFTVVHSFQFQGTAYVKRYRFFKQGNSIILQTADVQVPEETKGKDWQNFTPEANGMARFDIYEKDVIHHYRVDLDGGGAYTILDSSPRYIEAPGCYYHAQATGEINAACTLQVAKYNTSGTLLWQADVPTGSYMLYGTYGWANAGGLYLLSEYKPENFSGMGACRMFFSADGALCD